MNCTNCNQPTEGKYCSYCGQPAEIRRIDGKYIRQEIQSVLYFDKGILFTIKELIIRPGLSIQNFLAKDRDRLVKPLIFIIVCSLIYTLAEQFFQIEKGYIEYRSSEINATVLIFEWIHANYGYTNVIMAFFIGLWIKLLFRKYSYNFFEILVLLCYAMGISMLIFTLFGVTEYLTQITVLPIGGALGFIYCSWAIGQFFDKKKILNYFKGISSYTLGFLTFVFITIGLGKLLDLLLY